MSRRAMWWLVFNFLARVCLPSWRPSVLTPTGSPWLTSRSAAATVIRPSATPRALPQPVIHEFRQRVFDQLRVQCGLRDDGLGPLWADRDRGVAVAWLSKVDAAAVAVVRVEPMREVLVDDLLIQVRDVVGGDALDI